MQKEDYIKTCVSDILFAGCKLSSIALLQMFENVCTMAEKDKSKEVIEKIFVTKINLN